MSKLETDIYGGVNGITTHTIRTTRVTRTSNDREENHCLQLIRCIQEWRIFAMFHKELGSLWKMKRSHYSQHVSLHRSKITTNSSFITPKNNGIHSSRAISQTARVPVLVVKRDYYSHRRYLYWLRKRIPAHNVGIWTCSEVILPLTSQVSVLVEKGKPCSQRRYLHYSRRDITAHSPLATNTDLQRCQKVSFFTDLMPRPRLTRRTC